MRTDPASDETLVRALAGDADCLGQLLEASRPRLRRLARRVFGPRPPGHADEDDAIQSAFLRAVRHWRSFRGQTRGSFDAWLSAIARREACRLRDALPLSLRPLESLDLREESGSDAAAATLDAAEHVLCTLNETGREVAVLALQGLRQKEIALRLGISTRWVRSLTSSAQALARDVAW
ncbi:MAG: sigma-70 family RNA polymerase sigma factor [Planctomycetes bacterium]|nr:sigma-70 family RNA polymerase sigma factor [Planctomycetota bacterium]